MASDDGANPLASFLEKQREARLIDEELQRMRSSQTVEAAIKIKQDIEQLMEVYDLTPEQLMEAVCLLFNLAKPIGYAGEDLLNSELASHNPDVGRSGSGSALVSPPSKSEEGRAARTKRSRAPVNQSLVPAKKVTILSDEERQAGMNQSSAQASTKATTKKSSASAKDADSLVAPARGKRVVRTYVNPHTGETVKSRGANHRVLNEWRARYGYDTVEHWVADGDSVQ
ncbi:DNA binding protein [Marinobacter sp. C18]|uniref:DNA binding protein n=1 Tax=Marinobacter sp. C18 TaxID=1772288 RepID=UPI000B30BF4A|nr:DNA binding protein [Marinobacter sp. C18]